MSDPEAPRVWICGAVVLERERRRMEVPSGQMRTLFAFLAADRHHAHSREELIDVLWPEDPPPGADGNLSALLSRLRKLVGETAIDGRAELRLAFPFDAWVDLEVARGPRPRDRMYGGGDAKAALPAARRGVASRLSRGSSA